MKKGRHYSKEEIAVISQTAIGKSFREISDAELMTFGEDKTQKGSLGGIIEENLFPIQLLSRNILFSLYPGINGIKSSNPSSITNPSFTTTIYSPKLSTPKTAPRRSYI